MHEVDMTRCLVLSMNEWKLRHAPLLPRVERVHLQVGEFTCVEPEALHHTWQVAVADSWLAGSDLAIESVPLLARCLACQATYQPQQERAYRSPCCGRPMEEIVSGRELRIRSVAFHLPDAKVPDATGDATPEASGDASPDATADATAHARPSRAPATPTPTPVACSPCT